MTRPLKFVAGGLQRFDDNELTQIAAVVQQAYANSLNGNSIGYLYTSSATQGANQIGSSRDSYSTSRVNSRNFPGSTTHTQSTTTYYGHSQGSLNTSSTNNSPLIWNGTAVQRSNATSLAQELFPEIKSQMQTGNELGSYRVASSSPGTGWVNKGLWFRDRIYTGNGVTDTIGTRTNYNLWLKTSGVTLANSQPVIWNGNGVARDNAGAANHDMIANFIYPLFTQWQLDNISYNINGAGTAKGSYLNSRRTGHTNIQLNQDHYESYPSGAPVTVTNYTLRLN